MKIGSRGEKKKRRKDEDEKSKSFLIPSNIPGHTASSVPLVKRQIGRVV